VLSLNDESLTRSTVLKLSMQGGDLFDRLIEKKKFSEAEAKIVFLQLLLGVKYLHDAGIAHRDLKVKCTSLLFPCCLWACFFLSFLSLFFTVLFSSSFFQPENVLLVDHSQDLHVKITDFGLARIVNEGSFMKTVCGTPFYLGESSSHTNFQPQTNKKPLSFFV